MLVIHVTLELAPEDIAPFTARLPDLAARTRAEEGCFEYIFAQDLLEPNLIQVTECWESQAALEAHRTTEHFQTFMAAMPKLISFSRRGYVAEPEG
jgi:quinol monooxygenase YgiN